MKESEEDRLKCAVYESTLSTATRSPFPNGEGKEEGASLPQKEANPASLRSAAPSKGRGSRGHILLPMEGGAPKGRRLDGGSGMKKSGKDRHKYAVYESTLSTADAVPLPQWGRLRYESNAISETQPSSRGEGGERSEPDRVLATRKTSGKIVSSRHNLREHPSTAPKGSQPRLAALGSPFQGKGLAWTLPPSYGRRCPEGAEVGWGERDEKERGRSFQADNLRKHLSAAARSPFPMGKATIREHRCPHIVRANTCMCGKTIPPNTKPSPRGEGGERSEPDRVLAGGKRVGICVSSRRLTAAGERRFF